MNRSEQINELAAALAKAQGLIEHATKDAKNPHFGSKYATLAAVKDACGKPFADNGLAVWQSPSADGNIVRMVTVIVHSSGQWIESDALQVQARDASPQAVGSAITYLRRYQLASVAGIAPDDDDAEAAQPRMAPVQNRTVSTPEQAKAAVVDGYQKGLNKPKPVPPAARAVPEPPPLTDKDIPF